MVVMITVGVVVCTIMDEDSDGTSEHEGLFEDSGRSVYEVRMFGVGGFPFLLCLLVLLYGEQ